MEAASIHPTEQKLTLTVEQFARTVGISRGLAYAMIKRGELPIMRMGRRVLLPKNAVEKWLESAAYRVVPTPPATARRSARRDRVA